MGFYQCAHNHRCLCLSVVRLASIIHQQLVRIAYLRWFAALLAHHIWASCCLSLLRSCTWPARLPGVAAGTGLGVCVPGGWHACAASKWWPNSCLDSMARNSRLMPPWSAQSVAQEMRSPGQTFAKAGPSPTPRAASATTLALSNP